MQNLRRSVDCISPGARDSARPNARPPARPGALPAKTGAWCDIASLFGRAGGSACPARAAAIRATACSPGAGGRLHWARARRSPHQARGQRRRGRWSDPPHRAGALRRHWPPVLDHPGPGQPAQAGTPPPAPRGRAGGGAPGGRRALRRRGGLLGHLVSPAPRGAPGRVGLRHRDRRLDAAPLPDGLLAAGAGRLAVHRDAARRHAPGPRAELPLPRPGLGAGGGPARLPLHARAPRGRLLPGGRWRAVRPGRPVPPHASARPHPPRHARRGGGGLDGGRPRLRRGGAPGRAGAAAAPRAGHLRPGRARAHGGARLARRPRPDRLVVRADAGRSRRRERAGLLAGGDRRPRRGRVPRVPRARRRGGPAPRRPAAPAGGAGRLGPAPGRLRGGAHRALHRERGEPRTSSPTPR